MVYPFTQALVTAQLMLEENIQLPITKFSEQRYRKQVHSSVTSGRLCRTLLMLPVPSFPRRTLLNSPKGSSPVLVLEKQWPDSVGSWDWLLCSLPTPSLGDL